jgi:hypothetical protein
MKKIVLKLAYWLLWHATRVMGYPISKEDSKRLFNESIEESNKRHQL